MQRTLVTVLTASAMTLGIGQARTHNISDQARHDFQDLEAIAYNVALHAEELDSPTRGPRPSAVHLDDLAIMKDEINQAGKELRVLESEKPSLLPWEITLAAQVNNLMADAARNETQALLFYTANGTSRPLGPEFRGYVQQVQLDTEQAAKLLRESLQLDRARNTEVKIQHDLGE